MRYFYDTEFIEDGTTVALISIGIVAEDGREYYAVNRNAPWGEIREHRWLMENVVPHLTEGDPGAFMFNVDTPVYIPRLFIAREVQQFLTANNGPIELWGYYSAYDHVVLAQLWGTMMQLPPGVPMWTNDVQQEAARLGLDGALPAQTGTAHNALDDARWTREAWQYLAAKTISTDWEPTR